MSGRVVWFRDGSPVTGFRKTDIRRRPRSRVPRQLPGWRLSFMLPDGSSVAPEWDHGVVGVTIETFGRYQRVEITGVRDWVIGQARLLLRRLEWKRPVMACLVRDNEPGPTLSGPMRRGDRGVIELRDGGASLVDGTAMRQLEFPARWGK